MVPLVPVPPRVMVPAADEVPIAITLLLVVPTLMDPADPAWIETALVPVPPCRVVVELAPVWVPIVTTLDPAGVPVAMFTTLAPVPTVLP